MRHRDTFSPFATTAATFLALLLLPAAAGAAVSEDGLWRDADPASLGADPTREIVPRSYRTVALDPVVLDRILGSAPLESGADLSIPRGEDETLLSLPLPDGGFGVFRVVESPIMEPGLAAKYPEIRTYRGEGVDDPAATVRFDRTPAGFHAMILSPSGAVYVDPWSREASGLHLSYLAADATAAGRTFSCGVEAHDPGPDGRAAHHRTADRGAHGTTLRTYRTAVAATGEYTAFHGGTVPDGLAAIVTAMNRVNQVYEQEVALRMILVANNDQIVYTNPTNDPYTNDNGSVMLGQNQANVDTVIGAANYDIGHVFSTGGGGIASLRVPCVNGLKARGVTGLPAPTGDPFWIDFVAHEMGHQWGGNHTFNGDDGSCAGGNRNGSTAYEPGSGSTIQAYAGICGSQNLQSNSDPYFHGISLDEIISYSSSGNGNNCPDQTATGNAPPSVEAGPAFTIPVDTPFELCGSGSDPDLDPLTFAWEEFDRGPAGPPDMPSGDAPIFRSFEPTTSPCRTFPRLSDLAAGTLVVGELLPTYARTMTFRLTARDNRSGGGGTAEDETTVTVSDLAGPFRVTAPDTAVSLPQGSTQSVTWNVASTDQAPVGCGTVDILLSSDGGLTYPTVLAAGVPNTGSQSVSLPDQSIFDARVQVRCATSIFFDISDVDFGIGVPGVTITSPGDGTTWDEGDPIPFSGSAADPEDGDLSANLVWTSSIDGPIGSGASFDVSDLSLGSHTITASATDLAANTAMASITVHVRPLCVDLADAAGFESDADGWIDGASTCSTGTFIRGTPDEVVDGGVTTQPAGASAGTFAWFTQNNGGGVGTDDVDGGTCETLSPVVAVGGDNATLLTAFVDYFHGQRDDGDDAADGFSIELIDADTEAVLETLVEIGDVSNDAVWTGVWAQHLGPPANVRLRVRATDGPAGGDLVEAGVDEVRICTSLADSIFADGFESGDTTAW